MRAREVLGTYFTGSGSRARCTEPQVFNSEEDMDPVWLDEQGRPTARCMDCNRLMHLVVGQEVNLQVDDDQQVWVMCDACAARLEKAKSGRTN